MTNRSPPNSFRSSVAYVAATQPVARWSNFNKRYLLPVCIKKVVTLQKFRNGSVCGLAMLRWLHRPTSTEERGRRLSFVTPCIASNQRALLDRFGGVFELLIDAFRFATRALFPTRCLSGRSQSRGVDDKGRHGKLGRLFDQTPSSCFKVRLHDPLREIAGSTIFLDVL